MKASLIIPIYNKKEYTQKCLESIFSVGAKSDFEIIVVDNASTDGSGEYLKSLDGRVNVINNESNLGFAKACNQGAGVAKGEYLLFLNNDTVVTPNWLEVLVNELDNNKEVAIVGSKLLYPDNTVQHAGIVFDEKKWPHHIYKKESKDAQYVNKKRQFQAVTGACLMIRNDIFKKVSGFDEVYLNGLEDLDLCLKVGEQGLGILYCPESIVYHHESITEGRSNYDEKNVKVFSSRWSNKIKTDYKDYLSEDDREDMGEFIKLSNSRKLSFKKLIYLIGRFVTVIKRDGFGWALAKVWRRLTLKI
ncbi:MAG: glycosyltransferase family 2 protein [Minisyncoccia bacterium]